MSTLMNIVNKKKAGEIKTVSEKVVYSELLGENIKVVKRPLSTYMGIMAKYDAIDGDNIDMSTMIPMINEMIFEFCPMFKEVDSVKAAREVYDVASPKDLPEAVFEDNISELMNIFEAIGSLYDMEKLEDDIKN